MANRYADWLRQADADLRHARNSLEDGDHDWACVAAAQGLVFTDICLRCWMPVRVHTFTKKDPSLDWLLRARDYPDDVPLISLIPD